MKKGPVERRIFINNLPYESKWQEVKDLFRREVGEVNFVELFNVSIDLVLGTFLSNLIKMIKAGYINPLAFE